MTHRFTFGIEEEFFLTDLASRSIAANPPAALFAASKAAFGANVSHEMLRSQIELVSPVLADADGARDWLVSSRRRLASIARTHGLDLLSAGTHPMAQWREQRAADLPRYERLLDDFQIIAQRNLLCGLHVHVAIPDGVDRVQVMQQVMPWLPLLLSLSASSPFWARKRTGLMSYRQAMYDEWPRTGTPDFFENERAYRAFIDVMRQTGSIASDSDLWWTIRPSMRYPTLELRIADACPRMEDALCIAAMFRAMVAHACTEGVRGAARNDMTRLLIEENRWRAKRFGTQATFLHQESRRNLPIVDWLAMAAERFGPAAAHAGDGWVWAHAQALLRDGGSAARQLRAYAGHRKDGGHRAQALRAVVDMLMRETLGEEGDATAASASSADHRSPMP